MEFTKLDYCQYLISSQINYTITNLAAHIDNFSHDAINRYLRGELGTPSQIWDNAKHQIMAHENAYIIFDEPVLDKRYSKNIELTRRQYSAACTSWWVLFAPNRLGNEHGVLRGIGLVSCIYVNPDTGQFWVIDYRIYSPDSDGKTKLDHVSDMINSASVPGGSFPPGQLPCGSAQKATPRDNP